MIQAKKYSCHGFLPIDRRAAKRGFTLIELSIVLVIIGLIIGGVLVGQDLINAAGIRAQIKQIEQYQTAVNTFRGKYGYLPGDMPDPYATQYGFTARGTNGSGQGDGNGIIQGIDSISPATGKGQCGASGELGMFWVDLSKANLVDGSFNSAGKTTGATPATMSLSGSGIMTASVVQYFFPPAKITGGGRGNFVYVWSNNGLNYFGITSNIMIGADDPWYIDSSPGLTVVQAYNIDTKIDDGLPLTGRVTPQYQNDNPQWAAGCYDAPSGTTQYAMDVSSGTGVNCALSFQFQ
jgi:prepilin-type N-terminal cleavage/methylation domain-containing protein